MKKRLFGANLGVLLLAALAAPAAQGGQLSSKEDRAWARNAVQEEKALRGAPTGNTVAVLYFKNQSGQPSLDPLQKGLALLLITDLSSVEGLQVVERVRLQALAEELGLGSSGLVEKGTEPRVGHLLGARWLVGGDLRAPSPSSQIRVDSAVLDVPKGQPVAQPSAEAALSELFRLEKDLLFGILKALKVSLTPQQEARLRRPCSRSASALLALSRAVDASDAGRYEEAAEQYRKALQEDPEVCLAGEGLKELQAVLPAPRKAQSRDVLRSLRGETSLTNQLTPKDQIRRQINPREIPTSTDIDVIFPSQ